MRPEKKVVKLITILCGIAALLSFGYGLSFYYRGLPSTPNPQIGRIYPLDNHGSVTYMTKHEKDQQEMAFVVFVAIFLALVFIDHFLDPFDKRKWSNLLQNQRPPWDHRWGPQ
jgi:hypothetical protein